MWLAEPKIFLHYTELYYKSVDCICKFFFLALKEEHESIKSTLLESIESLQNDERRVVEEKSKLLGKNLDSIQLGIEEAKTMMSLAAHLQHMEAEKQKLKSQVKRLCQENAWLREELNSVQQQHQIVGQQLAQLEEENKHLEVCSL